MDRSKIVLVVSLTIITFAGVGALAAWRPDLSLLEIGALVTVLSGALERLVKLAD